MACKCFVAIELPDGVAPEDLPPMKTKVCHCALHDAALDLYAALLDARDAIYSLREDALGVGESDGGRTHWYIRDELLDGIDRAIAKAKGE